MGEDDIRNYLNSQQPKIAVKKNRSKPRGQESFKDFSATHLLCSTCKRAMPVRERLMLFLPTGNLYDYVCTSCGTSVGTRRG